jgi:pyridoxine 4-dehydrogenase
MDAIDLYQLHEVDPRFPFEDQLGALIELRSEGKIRHIGLSSVSTQQLASALSLTQIASVQGELNLLNRAGMDVMRYCEAHQVVFIPFFPLADGALALQRGPLASLADRLGCTPAQLALAWLLHISGIVLPIPGTRIVAELEENLAAGLLVLDGATMDALEVVAKSAEESVMPA